MESVNLINEKPKHHIELDWVFVNSLPDGNLHQYHRQGEYKLITTHTSIIRRCNVHENSDDHSMKVSYHRCASKYCIEGKNETCPVRKVVKRCEFDKLNYIYQVR
jgi:hypothetical protein